MNLTRFSQNWRFADTNILDPIFNFTRASTATRINKTTGLIETVAANVPRLEKDGLLIEGGATNLCQQNAIDFVENGTIASACPAPDGSNTAQRVNKTDYGRTCNSVAALPPGDYVFSVWIRADVIPELVLLTANINNDGDGGAVVIKPTVAWTRFSLGIKGAPAGLSRINIVCTAGLIDVWGWQIEPGPVATSYIPTAGAAEICYADLVSPWWAPGAWTIVVSASGVRRGCLLDLDDTQSTQHFGVWIDGNELRVDNRQETFRWPLPADGRVNLAVSQNETGWAAALNGGAVQRSGNPQNQSTAKRLYLGHNRAHSDHLNGHIRSLEILPFALPDDILAIRSEV